VMKFFVVGRKRNMRSLGFKSLIAKGGLQLRFWLAIKDVGLQ